MDTDWRGPPILFPLAQKPGRNTTASCTMPTREVEGDPHLSSPKPLSLGVVSPPAEQRKVSQPAEQRQWLELNKIPNPPFHVHQNIDAMCIKMLMQYNGQQVIVGCFLDRGVFPILQMLTISVQNKLNLP